MFVDITNLKQFKLGWAHCRAGYFPVKFASKSYNMGYALAIGNDALTANKYGEIWI